MCGMMAVDIIIIIMGARGGCTGQDRTRQDYYWIN